MSEPLTGLVKSELILSAMPNLILALILLNERYSPSSFWKPYISERTLVAKNYFKVSIDVLPESFNLPLYYAKDELQELQGSPVLSEL